MNMRARVGGCLCDLISPKYKPLVCLKSLLWKTASSHIWSKRVKKWAKTRTKRPFGPNNKKKPYRSQAECSLLWKIEFSYIRKQHGKQWSKNVHKCTKRALTFDLNNHKDYARSIRDVRFCVRPHLLTSNSIMIPHESKTCKYSQNVQLTLTST